MSMDKGTPIIMGLCFTVMKNINFIGLSVMER
jgi:hypothetical protein